MCIRDSRSIAVLNVPPQFDELQDAYFQSLQTELRKVAAEQGTTCLLYTSFMLINNVSLI